jgi:hypothetical protein
MYYTLLRIAVVPAAFIGWILFQLFVNKKKLTDLKNDLLTISVFLVVWLFFIWLAFS